MRSRFFYLGLLLTAACSEADIGDNSTENQDAVGVARLALGGPGAQCGEGFGECGDGLYCSFRSNKKTSCGDDGKAGHCKVIRAGRTCPSKASPVCGCDGETYTNKCEAQRAGASIASKGECPRCEASPWTAQVVDAAGNTGQQTAMALDADSTLHLVYFDTSALDLRYTEKPEDGTWSSPVALDAAGSVGYDSSIAVDGEGGLHVVYLFRAPSGIANLRYLYRASGAAWSAPVELDGIGNSTSGAPTIAVSSEGDVHIAFYDSTAFAYDLKYLFKPAGGAFNPAVAVDAEGVVGADPSIALDADGGVHVSYSRVDQNNLRYAYKAAGGAWSTENVDGVAPAEEVGRASSIKVDAAGGVHVSYKGLGVAKGLRYAYRASGGTWAIEKVDVATDAGWDSSLALDGQRVLIAHYDITTGDLKLARKTEGAWSLETLDATGTVGRYASLVVSGLGTVHVSYFDGTNSDLKYGTACY